MNIRKFFPMLINNKKLIYFDNAALMLKPKSVIKEGNDFYTKYSISNRTADSTLGIKIANKILETRNKVAKFVDANENEVIFTSGTTESLNLAARMLLQIVKSGTILLSIYNHSSNIVPFLELFSKNKNIKIKYFDDQKSLINLIDENTKIISLSEITNNFQINYDLNEIYEICKKKNIILINDCAQAIAHKHVSLHNSDVLTFSANKLYGPTGLGALVIKNNLLNKLNPEKWGGGQVQNIDYDKWELKPTIAKYEPGTANLVAICQFGKSIDFVNKITYAKIQEIESNLSNYLYEKLSIISNIKIDSKKGSNIILFNIKNIPSQDVASYFGHKNVYLRSGRFCAFLFSKHPNYQKTYIRISLSIYNTKKDIDKFIKLLNKGGNFLDFL